MKFDLFTAVFFPRVCVVCRKSIKDGGLCAACRAKIIPGNPPACGKCGARLIKEKRTCHAEFPYTLVTAGKYANAELRTLIHSLKFQGLRPWHEFGAFTS